jgi:hypothetical protein
MSACGGTIPASRFLRRRAAVRDLGGDAAAGDTDAFWAAPPRLYDFSQQQQQQHTAQAARRSPSPAPTSPCLLARKRHQQSPSPPPSPRRSPSSPGTCLLSALHRTCVGWGVTRRAEYPRRHRPVSPAACGQVTGMHTHGRAAARCVDEDEESTSKNSKCLLAVGKNEQEEEVGQDHESGLRRRRRAKKAPWAVKEEQETSGEAAEEGAKRAKRTPLKHEAAAAAESKPAGAATATATPDSGSPRGNGKVDRWAAWRYAAGEAALANILRERGATAGNPTPRAVLRAQARRFIGDTGLLDNLLRHVADKVPAGTADRVRRRYNPAGGMEYWIEPAGLAAARREAGVEDTYWVPPPGWKPGDPVSPEARTLEVQKQVEVLAGELAVVKRSPFPSSTSLVVALWIATPPCNCHEFR